MSDAEIDALLEAEGVEREGVDALLEWARSRAAALVEQTQGDAELGPLLREGGEAGVDERASGRKRGKAAEAREREVEAQERPARRGKGRGRGDKKQRRERAAELEAEAQAEEQAEAHARAEAQARAEASAQAEVEAGAQAEAEAGEAEAGAHADGVGEAYEGESTTSSEATDGAAAEHEPEWRATMHGVDAPAHYDDEVTTPRGEASSAGPLPPIPSARDEAGDGEEIDEIEELDAEELEMLDEEPAPAAAPAADAPTFGPPDGTDDVPAWRAALLAAETGSDREAAELMKKEESGMRPMPTSVTEPTPVATERLEAEEDEISQHKIDLSDLDGAPE